MKDKTWIQNPKIYASHDAHVKKSDHLKLRCDDGNRLRADFDGRAHSQAGRVENGWYGGAVRSGWDGWGGILDPRERRWMLICYSREREKGKWGSGCVRAELFCQNWPPFYPQTTTFFRICAAGWQTHFHIMRSCKLRSREHFIVWLHWFVLTARAKKDGSMVICHTCTLTLTERTSGLCDI